MQATKFLNSEILKPFTFIAEFRRKWNTAISNFVDQGANAVASDTPTVNAEIGIITPAATAIAATADRAITVTNNKVIATSIVFAQVINYAGAGTPVCADVIVSAGQFIVEIHNIHVSGATDASITFAFIVF